MASISWEGTEVFCGFGQGSSFRQLKPQEVNEHSRVSTEHHFLLARFKLFFVPGVLIDLTPQSAPTRPTRFSRQTHLPVHRHAVPAPHLVATQSNGIGPPSGTPKGVSQPAMQALTKRSIRTHRMFLPRPHTTTCFLHTQTERKTSRLFAPGILQSVPCRRRCPRTRPPKQPTLLP